MNEATQQYVRQHADDDVRQLALRGCRNPDVDFTLALQQIQGRQTARSKLPTWAAHEEIVYPPHLNMEQCSSEQTARYKAAVCRRVMNMLDSSNTPQSLVDLTGGFGVDFAFMAECFDHATYVERDTQLFAVSSENLRQLLQSSDTTLDFINADGTTYFPTLDHVTMFFLDPARRDVHGGRTYGINDCTPDVLAIEEKLLQRADFVLLKLSPMLDWRKTVNDLGSAFVREIHIVATGGECKEMLVLLSSVGDGFRLYCVNDDYVFEVSPDMASLVPFEGKITDAHYLYEPNAAIMKAGCFGELAHRFGGTPIAHNSHLFLSSNPHPDFPGRKFRINVVTTMNKRDLRIVLSGLKQANITVRNFPLSVAELRKRLKLSEGGSTYLFATTQADGTHILLLCDKL